MEPKYGEEASLCYMDTDSFFFNVKIEDVCEDIVIYVEERLDTSNYVLERLLPKGKNKKVTSLIKDELGGKIIKEFVGLRTI